MWKQTVFKKNSEYRMINSIFISKTIETTEYLNISQQQGGTDFHSRSEIPGTHTFFDTKILYAHFESIFKDIKPLTITDIGCGDGRATIWFLKNTNANIISVDGSLDSLERLKKNYLNDYPEYEKRVLLVHANILDIPIVSECCEFIWSFEVLCYLLADVEKGIQESIRLLKKEGLYVMGERNKEFGLLHELLNRGPEGVLEAYETSQIVEQWNDTIITSRVFAETEIEDMLKKNGLCVIKTMGVSFFPLLVAYLRAKNIFQEEIKRDAQKLAEIFVGSSHLKSSMHRSTIFISKKG